MDNLVDNLVPIIIALIAAIPGIIAVYAQRKRDKVESQAIATEKLIQSSGTIQDSYKELLDEFKSSAEMCKQKMDCLQLQLIEQDKAIKELIVENQALKGMIEELRVGVYLLIDQIERLGHKPVYRPKEPKGG